VNPRAPPNKSRDDFHTWRENDAIPGVLLKLAWNAVGEEPPGRPHDECSVAHNEYGKRVSVCVAQQQLARAAVIALARSLCVRQVTRKIAEHMGCSLPTRIRCMRI
jgi:hypothetical protein